MRIVCYMSGESPTRWPVVQDPLMPPTPDQSWTQASAELRIRSALVGRGTCSIYELGLYPQRLGLKRYMSLESPTPWYLMATSLYPPSPCLNLGPHSGEAKTRDCDTVPVRTKHSGGRPNV